MQANPYAEPYMVQAQPANGPMQPSATPMKPDKEPAKGFRDWPFAILFILNVGAIVAFAIVWGKEALSDDSGDTFWIPNNAMITVLAIMLGMAGFSFALSLLFVKLITAYARIMIHFVLWFNVGIAALIAVCGFYYRFFFIGMFGVIFALLSACYARMVVHRIPFAVANLRVAEAAISKHKSTYLVALMFTVMQAGWVALWIISFLGVVTQLDNDTSNRRQLFTSNYNSNQTQSNSDNPSTVNYVVFFFMLLSFYWGIQVIKNMGHTTITGTVASFWYASDSKGATGSALKRAATTSFGSICFGSLIVAIIQALRSLAQSARDEGSVLACIADCLLSILQGIIEYINRWAYVYVGVYGYKFTQAGKAVFELFQNRGWDAIINDDLIGNLLGFAALCVGMICAAAGAIISEASSLVSFESSATVLAILGLFVGMGVAITPLAVIDSSVATIFVCFAEDPAAFMNSHPELYQPLVTEWHNLYPELMVQAGYWHV